MPSRTTDSPARSPRTSSSPAAASVEEGYSSSAPHLLRAPNPVASDAGGAAAPRGEAGPIRSPPVGQDVREAAGPSAARPRWAGERLGFAQRAFSGGQSPPPKLVAVLDPAVRPDSGGGALAPPALKRHRNRVLRDMGVGRLLGIRY